MSIKIPVIAIDGPAASGKGTLAKELAKRLGWHQLDSGILYRIVGILSKTWGIEPMDAKTLARRLRDDVRLSVDPESEVPDRCQDGSVQVVVHTDEYDDPLIFLDGINITETLRTQQISKLASEVARHSEVRQNLIGFQRTFRRVPGLIADGRDMGTVVFPDADIKIFLSADVLVRARRRFKQYAGYRDVLLSEVVKELKLRDAQDMERDIAPLKPAADAILIDNTGNTVDMLVERVLGIVRSTLG